MQEASRPSLSAQLRSFTAELVHSGAVKEVQLRIPATATNGQTHTRFMILIDTGAEVCLLKKDCFQMSARPVSLQAANTRTLPNGQNEALLNIEFVARDKVNGREVTVHTPSLLYEAAIGPDIILSYAWLAERGFDVCTRRHVIQGTADNRVFLIPGASKADRVRTVVFTVNGPSGQITVKPKRALDLFSGTGSAARVFRSHDTRSPPWTPI